MKAFTLLELIIVIAIISIVSSIALASYKAGNDMYALDTDAQLIIEAFDTSRTKTLARVNAKRYSVAIESQSIVEFEGNSYATGNSSNKYTALSGRSVVTASTTSGNVFIFDPFTGGVTNTGTITLSSNRTGDMIRVQIYPTGIIRRVN